MNSQNTPIQRKNRIINKSGPDLLIADWLHTQNHKENKDEEISDMQLNVEVIQTATKKHRLHDDTTITTGNITK